MKRKFTRRNWQDALARVLARAAVDPAYRETCLHDPRAAVSEVSKIDLPADFQFEFVASREKITYCYALPPLEKGISPDAARDVECVLADITAFLLRCTEPTTGR